MNIYDRVYELVLEKRLSEALPPPQYSGRVGQATRRQHGSQPGVSGRSASMAGDDAAARARTSRMARGQRQSSLVPGEAWAGAAGRTLAQRKAGEPEGGLHPISTGATPRGATPLGQRLRRGLSRWAARRDVTARGATPGLQTRGR